MDMDTDTVMVLSKCENIFSRHEFKNPIIVDRHSHLLLDIDDGA